MYGIQVIGLSGLHSKKLIKRAGSSAEGVIFTDGYLGSDDKFQTRFFREAYKKIAGTEPTRFAAEVYDLAILVLELMKQGGGMASRGVFVNRLREIRNFPGVTGMISYKNKILRKEPQLIIVRNKEFRKVRFR